MAAPKFTDPTSLDLKRTLAQKLIPVADRVRDLLTRFGVRPYKVRIVRIRWTDGRRGVGTPIIERTMDLLPTPLVQDLSTMTQIVQPVGLDEVGVIVVSEISGRYREDDLRFLNADGTGPDPNVEVFYEIEFPLPDGTSVKRRFYLRSAPHYFASRFMWLVRLEKAHEDRDRIGDPS